MNSDSLFLNSFSLSRSNGNKQGQIKTAVWQCQQIRIAKENQIITQLLNDGETKRPLGDIL